MSVKKIFITLITIVACVIIGAMVLNVLLPNVTSTMINATEGMIYNATGMNFDFNGDGKGGEDNKAKDYDGSKQVGDTDNADVNGFE